MSILIHTAAPTIPNCTSKGVVAFYSVVLQKAAACGIINQTEWKLRIVLHSFSFPCIFLLFFSDLFTHEIVTKACYVCGMVLSAENSAVNKTDKNPSPHEACVLLGWGG